jgi:hypothetical protein
MRWAIASSTGIVEKYPENVFAGRGRGSAAPANTFSGSFFEDAIALVMRRAWVASHNARIMLGSIRPGIGTQN